MDDKRKQFIIDLMRKNGAVVGYLFGSYARGTNGPLSDLDVAVAFPVSISADDQGNRVENIRGALERIYGRDKVDVLNLGTAINPLIRYITMFTEGIMIFNDNKSLTSRLAFRTRREYEDTSIIRRNQREALKNLFTH